MKYVRFDNDSQAYQWDDYFQYLREQKERFPTALYDFAANWARYSLDDRESLHDSWIQNIELTRDAGARVRTLDIKLIGAYHDRLHCLRYDEVLDFTVRLHADPGDGVSNDLLVHEFRVEEDSFVHELAFAGDQAISVRFTSFLYREERHSTRRS